MSLFYIHTLHSRNKTTEKTHLLTLFYRLKTLVDSILHHTS